MPPDPTQPTIEDILNLPRRTRRKIMREQKLQWIPGFNKPWIKPRKGFMGNGDRPGELYEEYRDRMKVLDKRREELNTGLVRDD